MSKEFNVIRRGWWDCPACGRKNPGNLEICSSCGHTLLIKPGEPSPFYLDDGSEIVSNPEEKKEALSGVDWMCGYCRTANDGLTSSCKQCGASRPLGQNSSETPAVNSVKNSTANKPKYTKKFKRIVAGFCIYTAFVLFLLWLFLSSDETVKVTGFSWERKIEIEYSKIVKEESWELPNGADLLKSEKKFHHNNDILDHYESVQVRKSREVEDGYKTETYTEYEDEQVGTETVKTRTRDLGNGYFEDVYEDRPIYKSVRVTKTREVPKYKTEYYTETEQKPVYRQEPVYQISYTYKILRWFHQRDEIRAGTSKNNISWSEYKLSDNERTGLRTETYAVYFENEDMPPVKYKYECNFNFWNEIVLGDMYDAKIENDSILSIEKH